LILQDQQGGDTTAQHARHQGFGFGAFSLTHLIRKNTMSKTSSKRQFDVLCVSRYFFIFPIRVSAESCEAAILKIKSAFDASFGAGCMYTITPIAATQDPIVFAADIETVNAGMANVPRYTSDTLEAIRDFCWAYMNGYTATCGQLNYNLDRIASGSVLYTHIGGKRKAVDPNDLKLRRDNNRNSAYEIARKIQAICDALEIEFDAHQEMESLITEEYTKEQSRHASHRTKKP